MYVEGECMSRGSVYVEGECVCRGGVCMSKGSVYVKGECVCCEEGSVYVVWRGVCM